MQFMDAYKKTRKFEGGYANNPNDRGGATIFGISSKYWPEDFATVKSLVDQGRSDEAEAYTQNFYKKNFWDTSGAEKAPEQLQPLVFDAAVNHGVGTAKKFLASSGDDPNVFLDQRQAYMSNIVKNDPSQAVFQKGWENRVNEQRPDDFEGMSDEELAKIAGVSLGGEDSANFDGLSDEELAKIAGVSLQPAENAVDTTNAQQFAADHPILRTVGRAGRAVAGGLASLPDVALLPLKTASLATGMGLEKAGFENAGKKLENIGTTPSLHDTVLALIDKGTGGKLMPTGTIDKIGDFAGEMISSALPASQASKIPTAKDALISALNPQATLQREVLLNSKVPPQPKITSDDLRRAASAEYKNATEKGGILSDNVVNKFLDNIKTNVRPKDAVAAALTKDDPSNEVIDTLESMTRGQPMSLDRLQAIDESLGNLIDKHVEFGRIKKEGLGLTKIQEALRDMVESAGPEDIQGKEGFQSLSKARDLWARSRRLSDIERIVNRAKLTEQPATSIKAGLRTFISNPKNERGFSEKEWKAIKNAAETGLLKELTGMVGSRLFSVGALIKGGPAAGVAAKGAEMASRQIGTANQLSKAQKAMDLIANGVEKSQPSRLTQTGAIAAALAGSNAVSQTKNSEEELLKKMMIQQLLKQPTHATIQ